MRTRELLVYRTFPEDGDRLLRRMDSVVAEYGKRVLAGEPAVPDGKERLREIFYECLHGLITEAGNYGFHGNLWHCYLTHLLVTNENGYSRSCELKGAIDGTVNEAVLHDMGIWKKFFDYDFETLCKALHTPEFSMVKHYEGSSGENRVYNARICECICDLAQSLGKAESAAEMKEILTDFYRRYGVG